MPLKRIALGQAVISDYNNAMITLSELPFHWITPALGNGTFQNCLNRSLYPIENIIRDPIKRRWLYYY